MMLQQDLGQVLGELGREVWIAIGDVRDEFDEIPKGDNARVGRARTLEKEVP